MKTFTELIAVILSMVILASCGSGNSSDKTQRFNNDISEAPEADVTTDIETNNTEDDYQSDIVHESVSEELGTVKGDVYENKKLALSFRLPDNNWRFQNTEQQQSINSVGDDIFGVNPSEEFPEVGTAFSAVCTSGENGGDTICLNYQYAPFDIEMTPLEELIDYIEDMYNEMFKDSVIPTTCSVTDIIEINIAGNMYEAFLMEIKMESVVLYYISTDVKAGNYLYTFCISSDSTDDLYEYVNYFYKLN